MYSKKEKTMIHNNIKVPDCLIRLLSLEDITENSITLFGDSGKRYVIKKEDIHKRVFGNVCLFSVAKCHKCNWFLCYDSGRMIFYNPQNAHHMDSLRNTPEEIVRMFSGKQQTNFLPLNKQRHVFAVAEYMYRHAADYGLPPEEMYVLGMLHDVGYLNGSFGHGVNGANIAEQTGFKYHNEIRYHGKFQDEYDSPELRLLNEADLMIDSQGRLVGFHKRLDEIRQRYGDKSDNYIFSSKLVKRIEECKKM